MSNKIVRYFRFTTSLFGISDSYVLFCHRCREIGARKAVADSSNKPSNKNVFLPNKLSDRLRLGIRRCFSSFIAVISNATSSNAVTMI